MIYKILMTLACLSLMTMLLRYVLSGVVELVYQVGLISAMTYDRIKSVIDLPWLMPALATLSGIAGIAMFVLFLCHVWQL